MCPRASPISGDAALLPDDFLTWLPAEPAGTARRLAAGQGLRGQSRKITAAAFRNDLFPLKGNPFDLFRTPSLPLCLSYFPPLRSWRGVSGSAPRHEHQRLATRSLRVKEPRAIELPPQDLQAGVEPPCMLPDP